MKQVIVTISLADLVLSCYFVSESRKLGPSVSVTQRLESVDDQFDSMLAGNLTTDFLF